MLLTDAISFVRARLDEIAFNQDDMIGASQDDRNLDTTIRQLLPEAVKVVVLSAPVQLLEPEHHYVVIDSETPEVFNGVGISSEGVITAILNYTYLRLVSFRAVDSNVPVTRETPFDSPEARMQLNPYTRGTADAPVLVRTNAPNGTIKLMYYTASEPYFVMRVIDEPVITGAGTTLDPYTIFCPKQLEEAALNQLVGKVLETYNDQRAQSFYQKSNSYLTNGSI